MDENTIESNGGIAVKELTTDERLDRIEKQLAEVLTIANAAGNFLGYAAKEAEPILNAIKSNPMLKSLLGSME